jgi:aminoglycoside phosphotransferase (APT) family kinase protein
MDEVRNDEAASTLLTTDDVGDYLVAAGIIPAGDRIAVTELGGGVSNTVLAVTTDHARLVVKQALPRLRVTDVWEADPARTVHEGLALRLLHALTPDAVPECRHLDDRRNVLVVPHAPDGWTDWKARLLRGDADTAIAAGLGRFLSIWHAGTRGGLPPPLCDRAAFEQLRVDPYYRTAMARRPDLAPLVRDRLDRTLATRQCLVHGDFSPKNVLVGPGGLWVIDHEVAHLGDPAFDVAFMLSHLVLKTVHRPAASGRYRTCATAFADAYYGTASAEPPELDHVLAHVGCLLLARVIGKSPVEYLDGQQGVTVLTLAESVLRDEPGAVGDLWERLSACCSSDEVRP